MEIHTKAGRWRYLCLPWLILILIAGGMLPAANAATVLLSAVFLPEAGAGRYEARVYGDPLRPVTARIYEGGSSNAGGRVTMEFPGIASTGLGGAIPDTSFSLPGGWSVSQSTFTPATGVHLATFVFDGVDSGNISEFRDFGDSAAESYTFGFPAQLATPAPGSVEIKGTVFATDASGLGAAITAPFSDVVAIPEPNVASFLLLLPALLMRRSRRIRS